MFSTSTCISDENALGTALEYASLILCFSYGLANYGLGKVVNRLNEKKETLFTDVISLAKNFHLLMQRSHTFFMDLTIKISD